MAPYRVNRALRPEISLIDRYYLGIKPENLDRFYTGHDAVSRASKIFACMTMHLFSVDIEVIDAKATNTYRLLSAVADRPPRKRPVEYQLAASRFLLGDGLADRLHIPPTSLSHHWQLLYARWASKALIVFGKHYRKGWEVERVACTRLLVSMIVCWQLGVKRTKFTIKSFIKDVGPITALETPGVVVDEKLEVIDEDDEDTLDPAVTMGVEAGKGIIRRWKRLIYEMGFVVLGTLGATVASAVYLYRSLAL